MTTASSLSRAGARGADDAGAPYATALAVHAARETLSLSVPGHGARRGGLATGQAEYFGDRVVELDVTMLMDGIDLGADSPRARAERLAADAWGARRTWFLTGGSSQGNRVAALAARFPGTGVVMQRSAHSSFVDGIILAGLEPGFARPQVDLAHGIAHGVTPDEVAGAIARHPGRVSAVYVVTPSYFGAVSDVRAIADVVHAAGAALIVDAAWGAHFGFLDGLPESPARLGADLVVMSTHKLTGSLTQSALLHLGDGPFADRLEPQVERAMRMTTSTSESALLIASLDLDRRDLVERRDVLEGSLDSVLEARELLRADGRFPVLSDGFGAYDSVVAIDPFRIPIDVRATGRSGHDVRAVLAREHGIEVEMATATAVVAVVGLGSDAHGHRLLAALDELTTSAAPGAAPDAAPALPAPGEMRVTPRDAYLAATEVVPWDEAVGRVSADSLAAYPPGIPNVLPGEAITAETVAFLRATAAAPGGFVRGGVDESVSGFRVLVQGD